VSVTLSEPLSSSRMRFMSHNWSVTKQRLHPQSVAEIRRHSVLSWDRIRQCETLSEPLWVSVTDSEPLWMSVTLSVPLWVGAFPARERVGGETSVNEGEVSHV